MVTVPRHCFSSVPNKYQKARTRQLLYWFRKTFRFCKIGPSLIYQGYLFSDRYGWSIWRISIRPATAIHTTALARKRSPCIVSQPSLRPTLHTHHPARHVDHVPCIDRLNFNPRLPQRLPPRGRSQVHTSVVFRAAPRVMTGTHIK